jgi:protein PhnA
MDDAMNIIPNCIKCHELNVYEYAGIYTCPDCNYEWSSSGSVDNSDIKLVTDANGTELKDGDAVTVIKDLKVKGSSLVLKVGTKVKDIRIVEGDHDIDCKIPGIGKMGLKSEFVKKI